MSLKIIAKNFKLKDITKEFIEQKFEELSEMTFDYIREYQVIITKTEHISEDETFECSITVHPKKGIYLNNKDTGETPERAFDKCAKTIKARLKKTKSIIEEKEHQL